MQKKRKVEHNLVAWGNRRVFELKHLNGKSYTINNNAGSIITPGYKKVIANMGLHRDAHIGNLVICFEIQFPEKLSEETVKSLSNIL